MDRRLVTPTEAVLLLAPSGHAGSKCIQAGLLSLLGAERIAIDPAASPLKHTALLLLEPPARTGADSLPNHIAAIEQALIGYGKGSRLVSAQVLHALQKRFGYGFGRSCMMRSRRA